MQTGSVFRPRIVFLLLMPLLLAACARATKAPAVLQGDFRVHDPSMIKQDDAYYVFSTGDEGGLNHGRYRSADRPISRIGSWLGRSFPAFLNGSAKRLAAFHPTFGHPISLSSTKSTTSTMPARALAPTIR